MLRGTGCDALQPTHTDSVYESSSVDVPVEAVRLPIDEMPMRVREVISGRSVLRCIVEPSGRIDRCSIVLVEESSPIWSTRSSPTTRMPAALSGSANANSKSPCYSNLVGVQLNNKPALAD
jgi:glycyl-tRNA synthetase (class II)